MSNLDQAEQALIERLKNGDSAAVCQWYDEYRPRILSYLEYKTSDSEAANELTNEVFLHALNQLPLFQGKSQLFTWMMGIARHEVADYFRKKYAKRVLHLIPLDVRFHDGITATDSSVTEVVQSILADMPPVQQEMLQMKYVDGKSVADIAHELQRTIKAVEADLFRARRTFRTLYLSYADIQN